MFSPKTELFNATVSVLKAAQELAVGEIVTAQDAMIVIRVEFEELQARLRNRKIDGFEQAVEAMKQLSAVSLAMAAVLQSKILQQREFQLTGNLDAPVEKGATLTKKRREVANK